MGELDAVLTEMQSSVSRSPERGGSVAEVEKSDRAHGRPVRPINTSRIGEGKGFTLSEAQRRNALYFYLIRDKAITD